MAYLTGSTMFEQGGLDTAEEILGIFDTVEEIRAVKRIATRWRREQVAVRRGDAPARRLTVDVGHAHSYYYVKPNGEIRTSSYQRTSWDTGPELRVAA